MDRRQTASQLFIRKLRQLTDNRKARLALAVISEFIKLKDRRRGKEGFVSEGGQDA